MTQSVDQESVRALAVRIVSRVAPAERDTFGPQSAAYFADPQRALAGDRAGNDRLGSGLSDFVDVVVPVITPVALAVATDLLTRAVQNHAGPGLKRIGGAVGRMFGRSAPEEDQGPIAEVPADERSDAWRAVHDLALEHGKDEDLARRIADAVVGDVDEDGR
ncbi:hypothetical protein [Lentzea cavernae]|uniref:Excreted virulence factor EspC, type VII ESX diderm n=1 Tax=Lentzea cavernae TaxID=2020703 RepID=A0ABQ3MGK8_9PSEU|nr:hypothetical protein [Lentzea cavernae]GHH42661.1 hypothetical protein GCM10017774_39390 [Lentzea cavernae]